MTDTADRTPPDAPRRRLAAMPSLKDQPRQTALWVGLGLLTLVACVAVAIGITRLGGVGGVSGSERERMEAVIRDYLLTHPEIIPEAVKRLQDREVAKVLDSSREAFETPFAGAWAGAEDGDVVLVEFFDYACPYCRASVPDVKRLLDEDKRLKVVWRDFPVLGPDSEEAALASLAAAQQGRYRAFYDRMFTTARPSREGVIRAVRAAGMNEVRTAEAMKSADIGAEVEKNLDLGRTLGLTGTPSYIIGDRILSGAVGYDELKKAIAEARARK